MESLIAYIQNCFAPNSTAAPSRQQIELIVQRMREKVRQEDIEKGKMLDSLPYHIAVIDSGGKILMVNHQWERFAKENDAPFMERIGVGANYFEVCERAAANGEKLAAKALSGIKAVLHKELPIFELEYPCHSAREQRWFMMRVMHFESDTSKAVISHQDITSAVLSRMKIDADELRFNRILDRMLEGVQIIGNDWTYKYLNEEAIKHSSFEREQLIGRTMMEVYPGIENTTLFATLRQCMTDRIALTFDNHFVFPDQTSGWFELSVQPVPEGLFILSVDITERKRAEDLLNRSRQNYQRVIDNIHDAIMIDDVDGNVVYGNRRFYELFGVAADDLATMKLEDYVAPEYHQVLRDRHNRRIAGEVVPELFIYEGLRKDGIRRMLEVRVSKILEDGVVTGTQSAIRDITDEKEAVVKLRLSEAEKTKLLEDLTAKYNELSQFNYIVSHNLRSPIANIVGLSEILGLMDIADNDVRQLLDSVSVSAHKMDELVKDLNVILSLSTPLSAKKEPIEIPSILESICSTLEPQIKESGAIVNVTIAPNASSIVTLKSYLESILYNLISNAIKYRSGTRAPVIAVETTREGSNVRIRVSDNGIGIDLKESGKHLFGLYKRFNFDVEGKGLGLHMTKMQVEAMGGTISVNSQPGTGTTFVVLLPSR
jgi:PAS domain S-box-containing protein